jgi:DNA repair protein RadD
MSAVLRYENSAPTLRDYQLAAIDRLDAEFAAQRRRVLLQSPTGSGKTVIAGEIIRRKAEAGRRVLFLAPRRELVQQASRKLADVGIDHGIILAGDRRHDLYKPVQVASIDTLRARNHKLKFLDPHLVIIDEAHLYVTAIRHGLLEQYATALRVGLTATPCRKDGRGLQLQYEAIINVATTAELTARGHLVRARYFSLSQPDMSRVHTVAGDYKVSDLGVAMAPLVGDIGHTWLERAGGRRTAVFCATVRQSIAQAAEFRYLGVKAEHVDGGTPTIEREAILARFASGDTQVLCNVLVASIGFDLPALDCIVLARPTKSLALYLQMLGRGLRPAPGKTDCLVLDHSGCVHRLGFAADEREWTLDGHADLSTTKAIREKSSGKEVTCPACAAVYTGARECPECGHYIAPRGKSIKTLDGELVEVGAQLSEDRAAQLAFYLELRGFATERKFKSGFAAHKYKEKHGSFPPWSWNDLPPAEPSLATRNWIKSLFIASSKAASRVAP